jgi:two-component system heavy metal sensor histidine kinase CusS
MSSNFVIERLDARRWSLTARLGVFFGAAIAVLVVGVSLMMYAELVHQLHEKEELELKNAMAIELEVLDSLARRQQTTQWQHEWDEHQEQSRLFAWQLRSPDGAISTASSNPAGMPAGAAAVRTAKFLRVREPAPAIRTFLVLQIGAGGRHPPGTLLRGALDVSQDEKVLTRYRAKLLGV